MADKLLRRPEVESVTGLGRSTLYDWMSRGEFPQPVKLGTRLVAWRQSDIEQWLESRETRNSAASNNPAAMARDGAYMCIERAA